MEKNSMSVEDSEILPESSKQDYTSEKKSKV